ncbi:MAG: EAL domain-containing protein [Kangiellaceae bacterium]
MAKTFFKMKRTMDDDLKRLDFALNSGRQGWFDINLQKREILVSKNYAKLLDYPESEFIMPIDTWRESIHQDDLEAVLLSLQTAIETEEPNEVEFRRIKDNGDIAWFHAIGELVEWDESGKGIRIIGVATDISERKMQEVQLNKLAHYDSLTNLPNRNLFLKHFHRSIVKSNRTGAQLAVIFLDLDNFKPVNDSYGHDVGDKLLIMVAERISSVIGENDHASRQGGDEFALLLLHTKKSESYDKKLDLLLERLSAPYNINEIAINVTATIGVTIYPNDYSDADLLLRHADQAMYRAKRAGKNQYQVFSTEKDKEIIKKHQKLTEIKNALTTNQFQLYYQPKVNMKTGKCFGAEALIRWIHPQKGMIPPLKFLPLIDGMELEVDIGNWVIAEALKQIDFWRKQDIDLKVSVNIASYHLQSDNFIQDLENALNQYPDVNSENLELEILESSILSDIEMIRETINICRNKLQVNVALDDFGTGYSSLTHLKNLSANTIKIDQTFIRDMLEDPSDLAIIEGIISLSKSFNRHVIAEGVESSTHGDLLLLLGCENAQGYGISKPMPATEIPDWLNNYLPNEQWISESKRARSDKTRKLEILKITVLAWYQHFKENVLSGDSKLTVWPILDRLGCPCGTWIRNESGRDTFDSNWIYQLDEIHNQFHNLADDIFVQFKTGNIDTAKSNLDEFEQIKDKMKAHINTAI